MFNGLTAKDVADWLALNPNNEEVIEALARAFGPIVTSASTAAFDTGIEIVDANKFFASCKEVDDSERYY